MGRAASLAAPPGGHGSAAVRVFGGLQAVIAQDGDAYVAPLLQALAPSVLECFMRARAAKAALPTRR